jgi:shikimate kinase
MTDNNVKPADKKIIALIGMMGTGKTTIGSKLAEKLNVYFIDSDQEIEDSEQRTIANIFDSDGEEHFRKIEREIIKDIMRRDEPMVLSLGGGSFIDPETRKLIKDNAVSIWLYADVETILHRIAGKNTRPLLSGGDRRVILSNLIKERYPIYGQSDIKVDTTKDSHDNILNSIIKQISILVDGRNG